MSLIMQDTHSKRCIIVIVLSHSGEGRTVLYPYLDNRKSGNFPGQVSIGNIHSSVMSLEKAGPKNDRRVLRKITEAKRETARD